MEYEKFVYTDNGWELVEVDGGGTSERFPTLHLKVKKNIYYAKKDLTVELIGGTLKSTDRLYLFRNSKSKHIKDGYEKIKRMTHVNDLSLSEHYPGARYHYKNWYDRHQLGEINLSEVPGSVFPCKFEPESGASVESINNHVRTEWTINPGQREYKLLSLVSGSPIWEYIKRNAIDKNMVFGICLARVNENNDGVTFSQMAKFNMKWILGDGYLHISIRG